MITPSSPHFSPLDLSGYFNAERDGLMGGFSRHLKDDGWSERLSGLQSLRGIPFLFGSPGSDDVVILRPGERSIEIQTEAIQLTYLLFVQAAPDLPDEVPPGFGKVAPVDNPSAESIAGNTLGNMVSTYSLLFEDGTQIEVPVYRRFAIQQRHVCWGASPFAAMPSQGPHTYLTYGENLALGRRPGVEYGIAEGRNQSGRHYLKENLWLYAMPNPHHDKRVKGVRLQAVSEESLVYAISKTNVREHPLRLQQRQKARLRLPEGVALNVLGELDADDAGDQIGIDLGTVISARRVLHYSATDWISALHDVQPTPSADEVIVEYTGHPDARIFLRTAGGKLISEDLSAFAGAPEKRRSRLEFLPVASANRAVKFLIVEKGTRTRVPARLHVHGPNGEYLPPRGHHRKVNTGFFEDNYAEFANGHNQYAYVDGACIVDLPVGQVSVDISKGFEIRPLRRIVEISDETDEIVFELEKVLHWRERGWISSDTHVHFLSPTTALLEGQAEGVNVVNLLASQWGEMFSNVGDFDGCTTLGAKDFGGSGEFLVRVGTENRQQVLGHISLLGYEGPMIDPLCTGGADESAIGDDLVSTMADWAERCRQQGGLVVMPHAPNPQAERAADIVLGLVDALEIMTMNPRRWQISAFALADWYRFLNIGHQLPLVAGSDKMDAAALLGGIRTYAKLDGRDFTYKSWMDCIRLGNTFVTVGPLVDFQVEGRSPGNRIHLPSGGGKVMLRWEVESVSVQPTVVEVIRNGLVVDQYTYDRLSLLGHCAVNVTESCWLALRVRGSVDGREEDIAAHTSAVCIDVAGRPVFAATDAIAVLSQIEGSIAYLDTLAPNSSEAKQARMRAALELAHHRLHHQLHDHGVGHDHTPVHSVHLKQEH
ncbi:CehA/McbA family metallohydrolase [Mesorhizobium erdmanii]|uniref:CehA/McbA family metallohydrolase n=1 Tax=Mesorhizobium erdmanii TaxID=1777866 RepID=UPI001FD7713B|nr:CehA/McbA family metallohydrolase [Mesorhizobium erdmanii]